MYKTTLRLAYVAALLVSTSSYANQLTPFRLAKANTANTIGEDVWAYAIPKQLGYFAQEGLDVSLLPAQGLAAGQMLVNNGAEVATQLAEGVLKLREQGADVTSIFTIKMNLGYSVAVLPDSPVTNLSQLVGKTIGFGQVGSGSEVVLQEQLRRDGITGKYNALSLGYGAQVATALKSRQVDGIYFWDAFYGLMSNQGVAMRTLEVPLQDHLAGFQLVTRSDLIKSKSKELAGFCRAIAKAYLFARTNPTAAVELFYKEFPATLPAGKTRVLAVEEGTVIMNRWLESSMKGVTEGKEPGTEYQARWAETANTFKASGMLQQNASIEGAYTNQFIKQCHDFDQAAVIKQAKESAENK